MSAQDNTNRGRLFGLYFFPALIIGVLIIVALLVLSYAGNRRAAPSADAGNARQRQLSAQTMNTLRNQYDKLGESMGPSNAPVTIREFGDYQCPACGAFEPVAQHIRQSYVKTGKARFIFFDFPLPMHQHAQAAAIAARCAAGENDFWAYHDRLYKTQSKWAQESDPTSTFLDLAVETGIDSSKLQACIKSQSPLPTIKQERAAGKLVKLRATPTILVGRTEFVGGRSYDKLEKAINSALGNKSQGENASSGSQ